MMALFLVSVLLHGMSAVKLFGFTSENVTLYLHVYKLYKHKYSLYNIT